MKIDEIVPICVTVSLLVLGAVYRSPAFAAAAVVSMGCGMAYALMLRRAVPVVKAEIPEELTRQIQNMNTRITTIEYGIKQRGF